MSSVELKQPLLTGGVLIVLAFTLAYLAAAALGALAVGNAEFIIYIWIMLVLVGAVGFVHYRVRLTLAALWALTIWGAAHMAGGLVAVPESWPISGDIHVLYSLWLVPGRLKYDQVVHAYGFGVTTWVCWQGLRSVLLQYGPARPTYGLMILCAAGGMGFGAMNEVIEFAATLLVPETNVGGYLNTGWDLVANLAGTTIAATLIALTGRGKMDQPTE